MTSIAGENRSALGEFTRSALGERDGNSTPALVALTLSDWPSSGIYSRIDNPFGTLISDSVGSDSSGLLNIGCQRFNATTFIRSRCIRRRIGDQSGTILQSLVNPVPATPLAIIWRVYFDDYDVNFTPSLNVYSVIAQGPPYKPSYQTFGTLLASVAVNTLTKHAFNDISLNVASYLAAMTTVAHSLMIASSDDAASADPGLSAATPNALFRIAEGNLAAGFRADTLTFNY